MSLKHSILQDLRNNLNSPSTSEIACKAVSGRRASVLVPLIEDSSEFLILFIRRSSTSPHHAGEVAFPGGTRIPSDHTVVDTALREAEEEIGIDPQRVEILGCLNALESVSGYAIAPVVGLISMSDEKCNDYTLNQKEVDKLFFVPLQFFLDFKILPKIKVDVYDQVLETYWFEWKDPNTGIVEIIWGITGEILVNLLNLVKPTILNGSIEPRI